MKSVRERFEEIWPVPNVIFWCQDIGRYAPMPDEVLQYERMNEQWAHEHNARLDTFTRCQETIAAVDQRGAEMRGLLAETSKAILRHQAEQPMSRRLAGLLTKARAKVDRYLKAAAAQHTESGVGE